MIKKKANGSEKSGRIKAIWNYYETLKDKKKNLGSIGYRNKQISSRSASTYLKSTLSKPK